jgi:hypothetical protein
MDMTTGDDDSFELIPGPVGRGRRSLMRVVAVVAIGLLIVLAAMLTRHPSGSGIARIAQSPAPTAASRPIPAAIACHGIDLAACRLAVQAAVATLDRDLPAVESADVWASLMCGDTFDCPPTRLDGRTAPAGSVIVHLVGGGPAARINVVARSHGESPGSIRRSWPGSPAGRPSHSGNMSDLLDDLHVGRIPRS